MNQNEIMNYLSAGLSTADVVSLMLAEKAMAPAPAPVAPAPVAQPVAPAPVAQPVASAPVAPAPVAQPVAPAPVAPAQDFSQLLANLGASLQAPAQPQIVQNPTPAPAPTPSNTGITPEEATKLFQAWSMGQATQSIELPPSADEVLAKRFASLYGADTSAPTK